MLPPQTRYVNYSYAKEITPGFVSFFYSFSDSFIELLRQALKLAERTIQFADTKTILTEGYLRAGRVSHARGSLSQATKFYVEAVKGQPQHIVGAIGMAQSQMLNGNLSHNLFISDSHMF